MAILINNTATIMHGPTAPECGMPAQVWLPGKNPLDPEYWDEVKDNFIVKRWVKAKVKSGQPMIKVDLDADMPDPLDPPKLEDLLAHAEDFEIEEMLGDRSTPATWHDVLRTALGQLKAKQAQEKADAAQRRLESRLQEDKGLSGLPVRLAVPKVQQETDPAILTAWYDGEDRKTIRDAIDKRMGELEAQEGSEVGAEDETATEGLSEG